MNIKSEKGVTGIDITVATLVITIFISLIGILMYSSNINSQKIARRTEATNYAVNLIEEIKGTSFNEVQEVSGEYIDNTPYYKKVEVEDYKDINNSTEIERGIIKKVTVKVSYKEGKNTQEIELSTIISKGS